MVLRLSRAVCDLDQASFHFEVLEKTGYFQEIFSRVISVNFHKVNAHENSRNSNSSSYGNSKNSPYLRKYSGYALIFRVSTYMFMSIIIPKN